MKYDQTLDHVLFMLYWMITRIQ